jgi:hypothetical protein
MKRLLVSIASLVTFAACSGTDPYNPGTPLGTFHVVGKLDSNACGDVLGVSDPWEFDIKLAVDPGRLYWVQGGPAVGGVMDASSHATLQSSDTRTMHEADTKKGIGFCSITRNDSVDVTLAGDQASFTGTLSYQFVATDGSDCSDQLTDSGGSFAALPCTTKFVMTGTRTALPPPKK